MGVLWKSDICRGPNGLPYSWEYLDGKKIPVERGVGEKLHGRNALSLSPSFTLNSGRKARISLFFPHQKKKNTLWAWCVPSVHIRLCHAFRKRQKHSGAGRLRFTRRQNTVWISLANHPVAMSFSKMELWATSKSSDPGIISDYVRDSAEEI